MLKHSPPHGVDSRNCAALTAQAPEITATTSAHDDGPFFKPFLMRTFGTGLDRKTRQRCVMACAAAKIT